MVAKVNIVVKPVNKAFEHCDGHYLTICNRIE